MTQAIIDMYICICKQINQQKALQAINEGAVTIKALAKTLELGRSCGSCIPAAKQLIEQSLMPPIAYNSN